MDLAVEVQRAKLAGELLGRLLRETREHAFIRVADLPHAGLEGLLGNYWVCFGWRERRRLARAADWRLAMVQEVLGSVGHDLESLGGGRLEVNAGAYIATKQLIARHERARGEARKPCAKRRAK